MDEDGILTMGLFDFLLDPDSLNMWGACASRNERLTTFFAPKSLQYD